MLAFNESGRIERTLRSLPHEMPALVVDHESTDGTSTIAKACGATVIVHPFDGFVAERRFALGNVGTAWTLMIDADEALDERLRESVVQSSPEPDGYELLRTTMFCGRPMRIWTNEPLLRLFRTDRATLERRPAAGGSAELHERWICRGTVRRLSGTLLHDSYPSRAAYRQKFAQYTTIEARGVRGSIVALAAAAALTPVRFVRLLLRGAALDGWRGLYVAFFSSVYPFVVCAKALGKR